MDDTALRLGIHELIGDYAERIDEDRLEEWPELFADPCRYLVISRANHAAGIVVGKVGTATASAEELLEIVNEEIGTR